MFVGSVSRLRYVGPVSVIPAHYGSDLTLVGPGGELTADLQR